MNIRSYLELLLVGVLVAFGGWVLSWSPHRTNPANEPLTVVLGGDFYAGDRLRNYDVTERPGDFTRGFPGDLGSADLHLINLEAPLTTRTDTETEKTYWLRSPPEVAVPLLRGLSVDGVSLANNHVLDHGMKGLLDTMRRLESAGIRYAGVGEDVSAAARPVTFRKGKRTVAFLAFSNTFPKSYWAGDTTAGTAYGDPDRIRTAVTEAKARADRVIVSFHWGGESEKQPKEYQRNLARLSVRSGADVVFGHHPHSLQPIERYRDGLIFYSLGNYFFSTLSRDVQYGLLAEVTFDPDRERPNYRMHLMNVNNYQVHYRPQYVETYERPLVLGLAIGRLDFVRLANRSFADPRLEKGLRGIRTIPFEAESGSSGSSLLD